MDKRLRWFAVLTAVAFLFALTVCRHYEVTTVTLQEEVGGYSGTRDAHLLEFPGLGYNDRNTGGYHTMEAGRFVGSADDADKAIVIEFDLSSISSSAYVIGATLELYFIGERGGIEEPKFLAVHRLTEAWVEGEGAVDINGEDVPGVDWDWLAALPPKFDGKTITEKRIEATPDIWYSFDITSVVRDWVRGVSPNYGVLINENDPGSADGTKQFRSSEYSDVSKRPKLTVRCQ